MTTGIARLARRLADIDPMLLDEPGLTSHYAAVNTTLIDLAAATDDARSALGLTLTELIARRLLADHPDAAYLAVVRPAAVPCPTQHVPGVSCHGHSAPHAPTFVAAADGTPLASVTPDSPVVYLVERLSALLDDPTYGLDLRSREWIPLWVAAA